MGGGGGGGGLVPQQELSRVYLLSKEAALNEVAHLGVPSGISDVVKGAELLEVELLEAEGQLHGVEGIALVLRAAKLHLRHHDVGKLHAAAALHLMDVVTSVRIIIISSSSSSSTSQVVASGQKHAGTGERHRPRVLGSQVSLCQMIIQAATPGSPSASQHGHAPPRSPP